MGNWVGNTRTLLFLMYGMSASPLKQSGLRVAPEVVQMHSYHSWMYRGLAHGLSMFGSIYQALNRSVYLQVWCKGICEKVSVLIQLIRMKISDCGAIVLYSYPHISDNYTARATIPAPSVRCQDSLRPMG